MRFLTLVNSWVKSLLIIGFISIFCACDKENDDQVAPTISVQIPTDFQTFSSIDTIPFLVYVSDNKEVVSISVDLQTLNYNLAMPRQLYNVSGSSVTLSTDLYLNQPFLESGQYYFVISASDGVNESKVFVQVQINAIQREIEKYLVVTKEVNTAKVFSSSDYFNWTHMLELNMDPRGAALNYRQNLLCVVGGVFGNADFYDIEDEFELKKSIPGFGTTANPYFLGVQYQTDIEEFQILEGTPRVRVLDENADGLYGIDLHEGFRPEMSIQKSSVNYVVEKDVSSPNYIIGAYSQAGLIFQTYAINGSVKLISEKSNDELFVWSDSNEGAQLSILNNSNDLIAPVYLRPGEALRAAIRLPSGAFLISTSEGLFQYSYANGGTIVLNTTPRPTAFYYDSLDGILYATEGNTLYRMSLTGNVISTTPFAAEILHFAIDYNR